MLMPVLTFAYAHTGFAYADILSYAELMLAYAHQSFAYATPYKGPLPKHEREGLEV